MTHEERYAALMSRCTDFAAALLLQLQHHPKLPDLISQLEPIHGLILRIDIEKEIAALSSSNE